MPVKPVTLKKDIDEILSILGKNPIFKEFSLELLRKISDKIQVRTFAKDYALTKEGWPGIRLYLIKSGSCRVIIGPEKFGNEFAAATIESGECIGEMSLLTGEPCCATVKTNEDAALYFITKSDFDDIISKEALIHEHFNKILVERLRNQNIKSMHIKEHEIALNRYLKNLKAYEYSCVIGKSRKTVKVLQEAEDLSKLDAPITIVGEPGSGKELLARKIHTDSVRSETPVIEIMLSNERRMMEIEIHNERRKRDVVECELFGNEKIELLNEPGRRIGLLELADKGTLIIKNIENMLSHIQERFLKFIETGTFLRVGGDGPIHSNVRIIALTKDISLARKHLDSKLFNLLSTHKLEIPPLREHKKDIPCLMEHFADKASKMKGLQVKRLSKDATNKLLKYDYPGNVKELKNVIERAVELSRENVIIEEEEIFHGETEIEGKIRFNLLKIPFIERFCKSQKMFLAAKIIILISFLLTLSFAILQPDFPPGGKNFAAILCWKVWWPLLFVTFLFAGRLGCGVCPLSTISKFINRYVNLKLTIPSFIKRHDAWIMGIGFLSVIFIENYTDMPHSATKTAYLILSVLFGTIIFDFILERAAWCLHLCPLGGMSRLFSMSSMTEIRANKNVCTTLCTTHDCYKGSEKVEPCPMFLHLQFLTDNSNCKVCLNCIKNCKFNAIQLNLRIPGAEISSLRQPSFAGALFSIILCGLLFAETLTKLNSNQPGVPFIFIVSILFVLTLNFISNYFTASGPRSTVSGQLRYFGYTLLPFTLLGYIALKLMEVFEDVKGSLVLFSMYKFNYNSLNTIQIFLVIIGFFTTEYLTYKVVQNRTRKENQSKAFAILGIVPLIFALLLIWLFYNGTGIL